MATRQLDRFPILVGCQLAQQFAEQRCLARVGRSSSNDGQLSFHGSSGCFGRRRAVPFDQYLFAKSSVAQHHQIVIFHRKSSW